MICGGEICGIFVVTNFGHGQSRRFLVTTNVPQFSPPPIIISLTFLSHFEELKILNTKHQVESFFHIYHENYYRTIFIFFGHDELVTQITTRYVSTNRMILFRAEIQSTDSYTCGLECTENFSSKEYSLHEVLNSQNLTRTL